MDPDAINKPTFKVLGCRPDGTVVVDHVNPEHEALIAELCAVLRGMSPQMFAVFTPLMVFMAGQFRELDKKSNPPAGGGGA